VSDAADGPGLRDEDPEQERPMKMIGKGLRIVAGALALAALLALIVSLPGFVSDRDSMVPIGVLQATRQ
jgi:hypothetical protein